MRSSWMCAATHPSNSPWRTQCINPGESTTYSTMPGIGIGGEVDSLTLNNWSDIIDVNLRGVIHGIQAVYPIMITHHSGHSVNTASMAGLVTTVAQAATPPPSTPSSRSPERCGWRRSATSTCQCFVQASSELRSSQAASTDTIMESATTTSADWARRCGPWHPLRSPIALFAPFCAETHSMWCQRGGTHCGTSSASHQRCPCERPK